MSELPSGWVETVIKNAVDDFETIDPKKFPDQAFSYVDIGAIDNSVQKITEPKNFLGSEAPSRARRVIKSGDVLFSTVRTYLRNVAQVPSELDGQLTSTGISVLRSNEAIDPGYLFRWVSSSAFIDEISKSQDGTLYPAVRDSDVHNGPIPLPPLPEQRRIVKKLDTLSARTSSARTNLAAVTTLVEQYKLSVLGALFGKSGSDTKPADELWTVPEQWNWMQVKDIGEVGLGRQRSPENHHGPSMRPYIRSANITWSGVDTSDVKEMNFDAADFERFELKEGDVLLNEGSGSAKEVGKPAIWRSEIPECCFQNTVLRVQPKLCSSEFLYWYFLLTALSEGFVKDTKGVNIQHIGKRGLSNFPIPVPPRAEQDGIVRQIEMAFQKIDRLAAEAEKAVKLIDNLDQRILAKAFAGELVPQNSNDEPASALLARIQESRANAPKAKRQPRVPKRASKKKTFAELLDAWPATGMSFEELRDLLSASYTEVQTELFKLMSGNAPSIKQEFDTSRDIMLLKKVKA